MPRGDESEQGTQGMGNVWVWQACSKHIEEEYCSLVQITECDRRHYHTYKLSGQGAGWKSKRCAFGKHPYVAANGGGRDRSPSDSITC